MRSVLALASAAAVVFLGISPAWAQLPWEPVVGASAPTSAGFGDADNTIVISSAELGGFLYAGLRNDTGAEVWRLATAIFADGFESAGTARWSSTVP